MQNPRPTPDLLNHHVWHRGPEIWVSACPPGDSEAHPNLRSIAIGHRGVRVRWGMSFRAPLLGVPSSHLAQVFIPQPTPTLAWSAQSRGTGCGSCPGGGGAEQGGARGGLVTPVVACPPLPVSAKPADAGRGSGDKLCRYMRALQRSPFPIQPASLHPSNIQGSQVLLLPFLPPWPLCCFCPPPVEDWKLPTSCWEHTKKMNLQDKSL